MKNKYGNVFFIQSYNQMIAALPQKWRRQVKMGEVGNLFVCPILKTNASMKLEDSNQQVQISKGIGIRVGLALGWRLV